MNISSVGREERYLSYGEPHKEVPAKADGISFVALAATLSQSEAASTPVPS